MEKTKTSVIFILDQSGSMDTVKGATIEGVNTYFSKLREDKNVNYRVTFTTFNTEMTRWCTDATLGEVKKLHSENYKPDGSTALYDAACDTLLDHKNESAKTLVVIMTDGEENASRRYDEQKFRDFVTLLKHTGVYSFVFLGANQDAWKNAAKWGFEKQNVATYNSTDVGVKRAFSSMAMNTVMMANAQANNTANFFSPQDQTDLNSAK